MPILKQETKEIILPVSGAKIKILTRINYGSILGIKEKDLNQKETILELATLLIIDWDLTNEKNVKLPITIESIKSLEFEDGNFLIGEINGSIAEKKTLISQ